MPNPVTLPPSAPLADTPSTSAAAGSLDWERICAVIAQQVDSKLDDMKKDAQKEYTEGRYYARDMKALNQRRPEESAPAEYKRWEARNPQKSLERPSMRPVADATVKQNPMDLSQVRCFHCNETGHMRRDCGSKVARPRPTDAVLPKYVRATVRVADPTPNIGEADPVVYGGPCSYCKNPSHVMLNCWKLAREKPELSRSIGQKPRQVRAAYVQHLADPESQDSEFNEEEGCVQTPLKQRVTTAGGCVHSPERYRPPEDDSDEGWWCNMYRAPGNTVYSIALASTGDSSHVYRLYSPQAGETRRCKVSPPFADSNSFLALRHSTAESPV